MFKIWGDFKNFPASKASPHELPNSNLNSNPASTKHVYLAKIHWISLYAQQVKVAHPLFFLALLLSIYLLISNWYNYFPYIIPYITFSRKNVTSIEAELEFCGDKWWCLLSSVLFQIGGMNRAADGDKSLVI